VFFDSISVAISAPSLLAALLVNFGSILEDALKA